ncbi:iron-sulfur cluster assembly scaffold protein [Ureaplasma sp. ES3154-GEN]|uniref:iron-sulfur cluster assembly scaffold protein n=1 Tax=Ureaplasma sp. ES3154-GEN TaxID=2984844 RepID=UPI0021E7BE69|nr:iron-sulfur cluster assembly scaffold protein [Ureaplasma sp. ES3154-GEN]MCV3743513.1 iron-sulfur cluster assembly scaffold protein [Ureaplasma sp. ES3154-GEN]
MGLFKTKDPLVLRNIIMQHYEKPTQRIDNAKPAPYLNFRNRIESCIDDITVFVQVENDTIIDIKFLGTGCAIATASTDIMVEMLNNSTISDAETLLNEYEQMLLGNDYNEEMLAELIAFHNIKNQPNRIRCGLNGIVAIKECLKQYER